MSYPVLKISAFLINTNATVTTTFSHSVAVTLSRISGHWT